MEHNKHLLHNSSFYFESICCLETCYTIELYSRSSHFGDY